MSLVKKSQFGPNHHLLPQIYDNYKYICFFIFHCAMKKNGALCHIFFPNWIWHLRGVPRQSPSPFLRGRDTTH